MTLRICAIAISGVAQQAGGIGEAEQLGEVKKRASYGVSSALPTAASHLELGASMAEVKASLRRHVDPFRHRTAFPDFREARAGASVSQTKGRPKPPLLTDLVAALRRRSGRRRPW